MNLQNIKLNGRHYIDEGRVYFYNGGSGLSFKINGSGFTIGFKSTPVEGYFYIIVDHNYNKKVKVSTLEKEYKYSFDNKDVHFVDIVKANEANDNVFELIKLGFDGELLEFDESYNGVVKVFGDSTIAGFGILEKTGPASIHNSDSVRDFCYHALYELGMDIDILSASGYGLAFSAYTNPKTIGLFDYLDRVAVNQHIEWQDRSKANLIIISLGCNDNSYIEEDPLARETRVNYFKRQYQALIESQIKGNKDLKILMIYGTLKEENAYYLYEETYEYLKPLYKNLYIHKFNGDNTAISNHAYVTAHERMKEELKKVIKEIL